MAMRPFRVYDSDFVTGNGLITLAYEIARSYNGNWPDMIEYKRIATDYQLDTRQARSVLNMALSDSTQSAIWPAIRAAIGRGHATTDDFEQVNRPKLQIVKPPTRSSRIDMPVKFKVDYGSPFQRNGAVHLIDQAGSFCRWVAPWDLHLQAHDYEHRRPELWVHWQCGRFCRSRVLLFKSDLDPIAVDRALCTKCFPKEDKS